MKKTIFILFIGLLSFFSLPGYSAPSNVALPQIPDHQTIPSLAPMLQNVMPAVVNINVRGEVAVAENPFSDHQDENDDNADTDTRSARKFENLGSGVIVDANKGYILTNAHLIRQAKVITVKLSDGRSLKAKLIGTDPPSDIAVLEIKSNKLSALPLANSDKVKVGDFVAAIGNPFGLNQTVTSGIISGLERSDLHIEGYESFIQTDASINPGNSGGALVNLQGELIGINTAILAPSGGNIGISFAIPSNMAKSVMEQLIKYGAVRRGLMGVLVQNFTPELASAFNISETEGAIVTLVTPTSPAEKAGLKIGDIIQSINDMKVKNALQVRNAIGLLRAGSAVTLQVLRNSKPITIKLTITDPKVYQQQAEAQNPFLFGLALRDFYEQTPSGKDLKGVEVVFVTPNTAAYQGGLGLKQGDIILSANQIPITSLQEFKQAVARNNQQLLLNVLRQGGAMFIVIK